MSITLPVAELMLRESKVRPIQGRALSFGRSTVPIPQEVMDALFKQVGFERPDTAVEYDHVTQMSHQHPDKAFFTDHTFYRWLGLSQIDVIDVSDYEGADIVHDICQPLPAHLQGQYDFVLNSSVLDNVFDPAAAIRHMSSALKPGGRILHFEMASYDAFPYLVFSPGWFQDYYAVNDFERCQVYMAQFKSIDELIYGPWSMWACLPLEGQQISAPTIKGMMGIVLCIAERGADSTFHKSPIQGHYRGDAQRAHIERSLKRFAETSLPFHIVEEATPGIGDTFDIMLWKWIWCGNYGKAAEATLPTDEAPRVSPVSTKGRWLNRIRSLVRSN